MITLTSPITLKTSKGSVSISEIHYSVRYDNKQRICFAILDSPKVVVPIWKGDEYTSAGQWTDSDADTRLTAIMGTTPSNIQLYLQKAIEASPLAN